MAQAPTQYIVAQTVQTALHPIDTAQNGIKKFGYDLASYMSLPALAKAPIPTPVAQVKKRAESLDDLSDEENDETTTADSATPRDDVYDEEDEGKARTVVPEALQMWDEYDRVCIADEKETTQERINSLKVIQKDVKSRDISVSLSQDFKDISSILTQLTKDREDELNYRYIFYTPFLEKTASSGDSNTIKFVRAVSQVIRDKKMVYVSKYFPSEEILKDLEKPLDTNYGNRRDFRKIRTNGFPLLIQRLNLGFGLAQDIQEINETLINGSYYPENEFYKLEDVVKGFFTGKKITWMQTSLKRKSKKSSTRAIQIQAFTSHRLIDLLLADLKGNGIFKSLIDGLIKGDNKLQEDYTALQQSKRSKYFEEKDNHLLNSEGM